jgi:hypothetical protein
MKRLLILIPMLLVTLFAHALTKQELDRFNEVTKNIELDPDYGVHFYSMHMALFHSRDSMFLVTNKGDILLRLPNNTHFSVIFNFNNTTFPMYDYYNMNLNPEFDRNLDQFGPIAVNYSDYDIFTGDGEEYAYMIDSTGKVLIERGIYKFISPMVDGYIWAQKESGWGVLDRNFKEVVPFVYPDTRYIVIEHNIWVARPLDGKDYKNGYRWYMLDKEGNDVCSYDLIDYNIDRHIDPGAMSYLKYIQNRDLKVMIVSNNGKYGAVDENGKEIIPLINDCSGIIYNINDSLRYFGNEIFDGEGYQINNCKVINRYRRLSYNYILDDEPFKVETAQYFDINGNPVDYLNLTDKLRWNIKGGKFVLEKKGKPISDIYDAIYLKDDQPERCYVIPHEGDKVDQYFSVRKNGKEGVIDSKGKLIVPIEYDKCRLSYDFIRVVSIVDGKKRFGFCNLKGEIVHPVKYQFREGGMGLEFGWFYEGKDCPFEACRLDGKWGCLDKKTKEVVIPFVLDDVYAFMNGVGVVVYNGRLHYINEKGEGLPDEAYK